MVQYGIAYVASAAAFLLLDFLWLSFATRNFYRPELGELLSANPNLSVAAAFYLIYVIGVVVLAVMPAYAGKSLTAAMALGSLLGLVAYGTYDFTNLATIKGWPTIVSVVDLAWGIFVTAIATSAGYAALRLLSSG
jgi:uncharacterized membrane protein